MTTFWQLPDNLLTTFWQLFDNCFDFFFILIGVASCCNKRYGTNFISAVPTSLLIAPGLRTIIQFLLNLVLGILCYLLLFVDYYTKLCRQWWNVAIALLSSTSWSSTWNCKCFELEFANSRSDCWAYLKRMHWAYTVCSTSKRVVGFRFRQNVFRQN
jgi:hypothetical protein